MLALSLTNDKNEIQQYDILIFKCSLENKNIEWILTFTVWTD